MAALHSDDVLFLTQQDDDVMLELEQEEDHTGTLDDIEKQLGEINIKEEVTVRKAERNYKNNNNNNNNNNNQNLVEEIKSEMKKIGEELQSQFQATINELRDSYRPIPACNNWPDCCNHSPRTGKHTQIVFNEEKSLKLPCWIDLCDIYHNFHTRIIINCAHVNFGRLVGKWGKNLRELEYELGITIIVPCVNVAQHHPFITLIHNYHENSEKLHNATQNILRMLSD